MYFCSVLSSGFVFIYVGVIVGNQSTYSNVPEKGCVIEERNRQETEDKRASSKYCIHSNLFLMIFICSKQKGSAEVFHVMTQGKKSVITSLILKTSHNHALDQTSNNLVLRVKDMFEMSDLKSTWNRVKSKQSHMSHLEQYKKFMDNLFCSIYFPLWTMFTTINTDHTLLHLE